MPSRPPRTLLPHMLLLAVVLVWGTTFPLVKAALRDVSPLLFNLLRVSLAAALLLALNWRALRGVTGAEIGRGALVGTFLALGYQLQTVGLARTTPTRSAFLTGLVVVLVPLFSLLPGVADTRAARASTAAFAGAALAFAGVVLLTAGTDVHGAAKATGMGLGEWLTLGCAVAFAAHLLTVARVAPEMPFRRLGTLQIVFAALAMLLTLPLETAPRLHLTGTAVLALAITAVLGTAAAFSIQSWAQERLPASHVALIFTLEPVFAALTSLLFLNERLGLRGLGGTTLILGGILLVELRPTSGAANPVSLDGSAL